MLARENRDLALRVNREIWNERRLELIPLCFHEDFVADFGPYGTREGHEALAGMVRRAHSAFEGFRETILSIVADEERVAIHFKVTGTHTGHWGGIAPTGRPVEFDEIVIMTMRDGKVSRQVSVVDNLQALRQIGVAPPRDVTDAR